MGPPWRQAMGAQVAGAAAVLLLTVLGLHMAAWGLVLLHGAVAAAYAVWRGMPRWWWLISFGFAPLAWAASQFALPPWVWLSAFLLTLLLFWRTDASRVPLYMTNHLSAQVLVGLLTADSGRFVDLGCGDGRLLRRLARARPGWRLDGYEHAPLPALWAALWGRRQPNLSTHFGSFWELDLASYDVVYAFLSPVPMARLWAKACQEMRPGALLVSNSFAVPEALPRSVVDVPDRRATRLYIYVPRPLSETT